MAPCSNGARIRSAVLAAHCSQLGGIRESFARDGCVLRAPACTGPGAKFGEAGLEHLQRYEEALGHSVRGDFRFNTHLLLQWVYDLALSPALVQAVQQILGPELLLWSSDWVIKKANTDGFFSWHQDSTYMGLRPQESVVTAWVSLSGSSEANGCLHFVIGSHHAKQLPHTETNESVNMLSRGQTVRLAQVTDALNGHPVATAAAELAAGEMSLHSAFSVHSSGPNLTDTDRVGLAFRYITPNVKPSQKVATVLVSGDRATVPTEHFQLMDRPTSNLDAAAWAQHTTAMNLENAVIFAGAQRDGYHV